MRLIPSFEDERRDVRTYELADGRRVALAGCAVRQFGAANVLHQMGLAPDPADEPQRPVYWQGEMVGTLPGSFSTHEVRSRSLLYDYRPGDLVEQGAGWLASSKLGPGDLTAIEGFRPA